MPPGEAALVVLLLASSFLFRVLSFSGARNCDNSCRGLPVEFVTRFNEMFPIPLLYYLWYVGVFYPRIFGAGMPNYRGVRFPVTSVLTTALALWNAIQCGDILSTAVVRAYHAHAFQS